MTVPGCLTAVMMSYSDPRTYATLNPSDKQANVTLSNGNLTAVVAYSGSAVRATLAKTTGKWSAECTFVSIVDPSVPGFGAYDSAAALPANPSPSQTAGGGTTSTCPATAGYAASYAPNTANNDVWRMELDCDAKTCAYYKNNTLVRTNSVTGTSFTFMVGDTNVGGTNTTTWNFGATAFVNAPTAGFNTGLYV